MDPTILLVIVQLCATDHDKFEQVRCAKEYITCVEKKNEKTFVSTFRHGESLASCIKEKK